MSDPDFNPAPDAADELVSAIVSDAHASLADLAARYGTTVEALSVWMSRPGTAERLASLESTNALRARLIAGGTLPLAISTLRAIITQAAPAHHAGTPHPGAASLSLRAAVTLIRLAHFNPAARRSPRREPAKDVPPPPRPLPRAPHHSQAAARVPHPAAAPDHGAAHAATPTFSRAARALSLPGDHHEAAYSTEGSSPESAALHNAHTGDAHPETTSADAAGAAEAHALIAHYTSHTTPAAPAVGHTESNASGDDDDDPVFPAYPDERDEFSDINNRWKTPPPQTKTPPR